MIRIATMCVVLACTLALATSAWAHQTTTNNRATVTMHVTPEDEPIAGEPSSIGVTRVAVPKGATFNWNTCQCRIRVTSSAGKVVVDRAFRRSTTATFPESSAYSIRMSGRYKQAGKWKRFTASFAVRAS